MSSNATALQGQRPGLGVRDSLSVPLAFLSRLTRNRLALIGLVIIGGFTIAALFAPWIAPRDPEHQISSEAMQSPSWNHLFGTDNVGRDTLSRIIYGARVSLFVGLTSMALAAAIGVPLGLLGGYYGGLVDSLAMRAMDTLLAFPALLLAIFIVAVLGPSVSNAIFAIGIIYIPAFARLTRANVLSLREKEFVEAAKCLGAGDGRIMLRSILPNCSSSLIVQFTLGVGYAMLIEAGLSFLGLGVQPPTPAWGQMVGLARNFITIAPWLITFPGLAIFLAVLAFNFLGDGLREATDPRLRGRRLVAGKKGKM
ncbi:MAG: peptide/nickel transport system permease protein [Thermomicrobiales bacterium]|jgi:peptide/nickel transport system permease protein|nr:peptide/nickel transport system permease protein [Thermomicrobiales bacterium]